MRFWIMTHISLGSCLISHRWNLGLLDLLSVTVHTLFLQMQYCSRSEKWAEQCSLQEMDTELMPVWHPQRMQDGCILSSLTDEKDNGCQNPATYLGLKNLPQKLTTNLKGSPQESKSCQVWNLWHTFSCSSPDTDRRSEIKRLVVQLVYGRSANGNWKVLPTVMGICLQKIRDLLFPSK